MNVHVDPDSGVRYHDPIEYDSVIKDGKHIGWNVPTHERARWEWTPEIANPATPPQETARPIQHLVTELEAWLDLRPALEQQVRTAYERDPLKTSRAVEAVIDGTQAQRLTNPPGLLVIRLKEILAYEPADDFLAGLTAEGDPA